MNHLKSWTSSIDSQVGSFGGQLPTNSTMQCPLNLFDPPDNDDRYALIHDAIGLETTNEVTFTMGMAGETALERFLGCIMIGIMPSQGMEEALSSLWEMLNFYGEESLLYREHISVKPQTINGTIVEKKKRPDIIIT